MRWAEAMGQRAEHRVCMGEPQVQCLTYMVPKYFWKWPPNIQSALPGEFSSPDKQNEHLIEVVEVSSSLRAHRRPGAPLPTFNQPGRQFSQGSAARPCSAGVPGQFCSAAPGEQPVTVGGPGGAGNRTQSGTCHIHFPSAVLFPASFSL